MKHWKLLLALFAVAPVFMACSDDDKDEVAPSVTLNQNSLSFEKESSSQTVSITSTRDWTASADVDWIAISPESGKSSKTAQEVTITVLANNSYDRTGTVTFNGVATASLTVNQAGTGSVYTGTGTESDPYNVLAALNLTNGLASYSSGDDLTNSNSATVYVKGTISKIDNVDTGYGNATYYISDDGGTETQLEVYRGRSLGGNKFTSQDEIKVGDEVVVYGTLVNFKGNTPEFTSGSQIYSLNGKKSSGTDTPSTDTPSGSGTLDSPYNPKAAYDAAAALAADAKTDNDVYIKGKISSIANNGTFNAQYGNATFYISEDGSSNGTQFTCYRVLYLGNKKWVEGNTQIAVGDEVVICGKLTNYKGNTPETASGNAYVYSLNGKTSDSGSGTDTPSTDTPSGNGTLASPYNPKAAYDAAAALSSGAKTDNDVYIKGKISSVRFTFDAEHGTATFNISEDGTTNGTQFTCYSVLYLGNKSWVSGNTQVKVGDEVIICGKLTNYQGNTPETASKQAYVYSLNGKTTDDGGSGSGDSGDSGQTTDGTTITWSGQSDWTGVADKAETISYTSGAYTITVSKGQGANAPTVNGNQKDVRAYAKNTVTISTTGSAMTKIVFTLSTQGKRRLPPVTASAGEIAKQASGDETVTWTGSAASVTFTVGDKADYGSDGSSKAGQFDFNKVVIN